MSPQCEEMQKQLPLYIDGALSMQDKMQVEAHLAVCAACCEEAQYLRGVKRAAQTLPGLTVTDSFRAELRSQLEAEAKKPKVAVNRRNLWQKVASFAAVAAVLALSLVAFNQMPKTDIVQDENSQEFIVQTQDDGKASSDLMQDIAYPEVGKERTQTKQKDAEQQPQAAATEEAADTAGVMPRFAYTAKGVLHYSLTEEGYEQATSLLSAYAKDADGYRVPVENVGAVCAELEVLEGYVSHQPSEQAPLAESQEEIDLHGAYVWIMIHRAS